MAWHQLVKILIQNTRSQERAEMDVTVSGSVQQPDRQRRMPSESGPWGLEVQWSWRQCQPEMGGSCVCVPVLGCNSRHSISGDHRACNNFCEEKLASCKGNQTSQDTRETSSSHLETLEKDWLKVTGEAFFITSFLTAVTGCLPHGNFSHHQISLLLLWNSVLRFHCCLSLINCLGLIIIIFLKKLIN